VLSVAKGTVVRGNTPTPSGRREAPSPRTNLRRRRAFEHLVPGAQAPSGYISEHSCDPLALLAALLPDRMLSLVMAEVERMANDPLPVAERAPRIAALERELDELHRVEEALVAVAIAAGQPVHRSPSAPPSAVLGVTVAKRVSRAA